MSFRQISSIAVILILAISSMLGQITVQASATSVNLSGSDGSTICPNDLGGSWSSEYYICYISGVLRVVLGETLSIGVGVTLYPLEGSILDNYGTINDSGYLLNSGNITNFNSGTIISLPLCSSCNVTGIFSNAGSGTLINQGTIDDEGELNNDLGKLINAPMGIINIIFPNGFTSEINELGLFLNEGTINAAGTNELVIEMAGVSPGNQYSYPYAEFNNTGSIYAWGFVWLYNGSEFNNYGTINGGSNGLQLKWVNGSVSTPPNSFLPLVNNVCHGSFSAASVTGISLQESACRAPDISSPLSGSTSSSARVLVKGTSDPDAVILVFEGGRLVGQGDANTTGYWKVRTLILPKGSNTLIAQAEGNDGDSIPSSPIVIKVK